MIKYILIVLALIFILLASYAYRENDHNDKPNVKHTSPSIKHLSTECQNTSIEKNHEKFKVTKKNETIQISSSEEDELNKNEIAIISRHKNKKWPKSTIEEPPNEMENSEHGLNISKPLTDSELDELEKNIVEEFSNKVQSSKNYAMDSDLDSATKE